MNDTSKTELDAQLHAILKEVNLNGYYDGMNGTGSGHSMAVAKQALTTLIAQREQAAELRGRELATPVTIMGKTIEEICVILSALELERIADMQMTMSRLDDWMKLVREDHHKAMQKAINRTMDATLERLQATKPEKGDDHERVD